MAKAKYTVFVPNHAKNVAAAAHHFLSYGPTKIETATVQHGIPHDSLVVYAEESPEMDSTMKQLGVFVGEIANAPTISVAKEGKNIATWTMKNPHYSPQPPAPQMPQPSPSDGAVNYGTTPSVESPLPTPQPSAPVA